MFGKKHSLGKMWIEDYRVFTLYLFSNKTVPWHTNEDLIMVPLIQQTIDIKLLRRMLPPNLFAGDYFIHMKKFVCLSYWLLRWVELIKCQFCCVGVDISTLENSRYVHYSLQQNGVEALWLGKEGGQSPLDTSRDVAGDALCHVEKRCYLSNQSCQYLY